MQKLSQYPGGSQEFVEKENLCSGQIMKMNAWLGLQVDLAALHWPAGALLVAACRLKWQ